MHPHLAIYFGSPFGRYPTFHTLTSVGRKKLSVCQKNVSAFSCYSEVYIYVLYILAVPPLRIQAGYGPGLNVIISFKVTSHVGAMSLISGML